MPEHRGSVAANGRRFAIVVSRFNSVITDRLTTGALACLEEHGARADEVDVFTVPGAWELPVIGAVSAPAAVLIRPDGHVAWVGDRTRSGLEDALTHWFGPPAAARHEAALAPGG